MPLTKALEEMLATIEDEGDRKALRGQLEKHESLRERFEGNLRQSDYDRRMNEVKAAREAEEAAVAKFKEDSKKWSDWAARNVPKHEELVKQYDKVVAEKTELEAKVAEAAAGGGGGAGDGTPVNERELLARVNAEIAKRGYVTNAETSKIVAEQTQKMITEEGGRLRGEFYKTDVPNMMAYMLAMNELQFRSREEFGKPLDTVAFSKYIAENKIDDPRKAYEDYTADARREKWVAEKTKEITEKVEKDNASKYNLPGSGAPPAPELGPVQVNRLNKGPAIPEGAEAGDNKLAYAAAAELRAEGKW